MYPDGGFKRIIAWSTSQVDTPLPEVPGWWFGIVAYDSGLKHEGVAMPTPDRRIIDMPLELGFVPDVVLEFRVSEIMLHLGDWVDIETAVNNHVTPPDTADLLTLVRQMVPLLSEDQYLAAVHSIKDYIRAGDTYELNYCMPYKGMGTIHKPFRFWQQIQSRSQAPFTAVLKVGQRWLFSNSPERFLKRQGNRLISQPIKGTAPRNADARVDAQNLAALANSTKEQAENMMIVDLVRNDLARVAVPGTVAVDEMMGQYSFTHVHQLISTVSCQVQDDKRIQDVFRATFPMGSMTGAPKARTMQIINELEPYSRGWFSGAAGYTYPDGDFDFNVVIRSLQYHQAKHELVVWAGSAITWDSVPEEELAECKLKAQAWLDMLNGC